jgi:hypothetical protein
MAKTWNRVCIRDSTKVIANLDFEAAHLPISSFFRELRFNRGKPLVKNLPGQVDPIATPFVFDRGSSPIHRGSIGKVDLYPVEVSVSYPDVVVANFRSMWVRPRGSGGGELADLDGGWGRTWRCIGQENSGWR